MVKTELIRVVDCGNLGDLICLTGALKQYHLSTNKKFYILSNYPEIFQYEDYCIYSSKEDVLKCNDVNGFYKSFDKIISLTCMSQDHLQCKVNITEGFCQNLNVPLVKYPEFSVLEQEINEFNYPKKEYVLLNLTNKNDYAERNIYQNDFFNKYCTVNYQLRLINFLQQNFPNIEFININEIKGSVRNILLLAIKAKTFISVDTALIHICSNKTNFIKGICLFQNKDCFLNYGYKEHINFISKVPNNSPHVEPEYIKEALHDIFNKR
jgi:hypothetical protein